MKDRDWLNWVIGGLLVVLTIVGLITFSGAAEDRAAERKAEELTQRLEEAGLRAPDQDIIVRTLGDDGGNVCDNPASALGRAHLYDQLTNGASHVGRRPVIVDRRVILGEALILETYCPGELDEFRDKFDDLKFDETIEN
jgi:hypothetical protein